MRCALGPVSSIFSSYSVSLSFNHVFLAIVHGFGIAVRRSDHLLEPGLMPFAVGVNNHRQFILFVATLVIGIILFDYLTWACKYLIDYSQPI
jgi:hypothetical protein